MSHRMDRPTRQAKYIPLPALGRWARQLLRQIDGGRPIHRKNFPVHKRHWDLLTECGMVWLTEDGDVIATMPTDFKPVERKDG